MADPGWVYLVHPGTGGSSYFPDSPDVLALYAAKGWEPGVEPLEEVLDVPEPEPAAPASKPRTVKAAPAAQPEGVTRG
jgi:hypothetical protein